MTVEFCLSLVPLDPATLCQRLPDSEAGGLVSFEGRVRSQSEGKPVARLDYEAYPELCRKVGQEIVAEAVERFGLCGVLAAHRHGSLAVGETAIWVGVCAAHRCEAFDACAWIVERIKHDLPVWKRERFCDGRNRWVCEENSDKYQPSKNKEKTFHESRT